MVVVHGHHVGLVQFESLAVGEAVDDDTLALCLSHIIDKVQAVEDGVAEVIADGLVVDGAVGDLGVQTLCSVVLQQVLDLLTGHGQQIQGVVVLIEGIDTLHGQLACTGGAGGDDGGGGQVDLDLVAFQLLGGVCAVDLTQLGVDALDGAILLGQVGVASPDLCTVDQVDGVGLNGIQVLVAAVPLAGQGADGGVDVSIGCLSVGLDDVIQTLIHGIVCQVQVFALLSGDGEAVGLVPGDVKNGLGQRGAAGVDDQDFIAALVGVGVVAVGAGVIVTCNNNVQAGGTLDGTQDLVLGVLTVFQFLSIGTQAGVVVQDDEVALDAISLHFVQDLVHFVSNVQRLVFGRSEDDAGIVVGNVPTGAVSVFDADDTNDELLAGQGQGLGVVRSEDTLAGVFEVQVSAGAGNALGFQIVVEVDHGLPRVVELMVTQGVGVVTNVLQCQSDRVDVIDLTLAVLADVVGSNGGTLVQVTVVHQQGVLAVFATDFLDGGGDVQQRLVDVGVVEQILVPDLAVNVRSGHQNELSAVGSFSGDHHGDHRQDHGENKDHGQNFIKFLHTCFFPPLIVSYRRTIGANTGVFTGPPRLPGTTFGK